VTGPVQLTRLPVLDKPLLMEHFDELVCDPRLRRDELLDWVGRVTRDQLYLNRYRVMLTSGSSGRPGLYVYDASGWRSIMSGLLRSTTWKGVRPTLPRQRLAFVGPVDPCHIGRQGAAMASGLHRVLALPVTLPLPRLVEALNEFQPSYLQVYPSAAMWLVDEQHAGRLRVSPRILVTAAELRTPEMTRRLEEAFGLHPFNLYGSTEGCSDLECEHHKGIHLFEDTHPRRERRPDGQPVPPGQPGARLLVTNLYNLVQPLLRLEVTDLVTLDPDPCPCGRILARNEDHLRPQRRRSSASPPATAVRSPSTRCISRCSPATRRSANFRSFRRARCCAYSWFPGIPPAQPRQAATTDSRRVSATPSPSNSSDSAYGTRRSRIERRRELARTAGGKLKLVIADPAQWSGEEARVNLRSLAGQRLGQ
jgi:hypothetical protein